MSRRLSQSSWDDQNESHNFLLNSRRVLKRLGLGVTEFEVKSTTRSGYTARMIKNHGSISLILAVRMAYQLGFSVEDLIKPPAEFKKILDNETEGEDNDGTQ